MTPRKVPTERRRFPRLHMATRDCRLTLIRWSSGTPEREVCSLIDLSYAGLRFHTHQPVGVGEMVEILIDLSSPAQRSGFARARVRWIRTVGFQEFDAGAEFSPGSKGSFLGSDEIPGYHSHRRQ